jgi:hypothetical protein
MSHFGATLHAAVTLDSSYRTGRNASVKIGIKKITFGESPPDLFTFIG